MWINVSDRKWFEARRATAIITRNDLVDAGFPSDDIRRILDAPEFNEDMIRQVLTVKYGDCASWCMDVVQYDLSMNCLEVAVSSPNFEPVEHGYRAPVIDRPVSK